MTINEALRIERIKQIICSTQQKKSVKSVKSVEFIASLEIFEEILGGNKAGSSFCRVE